jgi:proline iminopeptidase
MSKSLYPVAPVATKEIYLDVGASHKIYVCEYGNPNGVPVVICHGGPGAGCKPDHASFYNPDKYRIILFDQRGCGKSTPRGSLQDNTTAHLIVDMEQIRQTLKIDKWVVAGGSWGSTLGLLYAQAYPQQVLSLVLRGIFLARANDSDIFYREDSPAVLCNPKEWQEYKNNIASLLGKTNLSPGKNHIENIYTLLTYSDAVIQQSAADILGAWEKKISYFNPSNKVRIVDNTAVVDTLTPTIIEVTYTKNHCYIKENEILDNIQKLAQIPVYIIQGKVDLVCPQYQAYELAQSLKSVGCDVTYYECCAGHAGTEVDIADAMISATDDLVERI